MSASSSSDDSDAEYFEDDGFPIRRRKIKPWQVEDPFTRKRKASSLLDPIARAVQTEASLFESCKALYADVNDVSFSQLPLGETVPDPRHHSDDRPSIPMNLSDQEKEPWDGGIWLENDCTEEGIRIQYCASPSYDQLYRLWHNVAMPPDKRRFIIEKLGLPPPSPVIRGRNRVWKIVRHNGRWQILIERNPLDRLVTYALVSHFRRLAQYYAENGTNEEQRRAVMCILRLRGYNFGEDHKSDQVAIGSGEETEEDEDDEEEEGDHQSESDSVWSNDSGVDVGGAEDQSSSDEDE
ncbi:hypothetical protein EDC01DRAFT_626565 [Geopyxis carbonaria]|nr:hypothetical protein EDC01DRAFT_626565 [Geopyxis carbonaria]